MNQANISKAGHGLRALLRLIGDDPDREGLLETPDRVVRAFVEMTAGLRMDPAAILSTTFDVKCDDMVIVRGVWFSSLCEHHLLPFVGKASLGYIPKGRVVGLSKLARLVDCFAKRLQVQERMTGQIACAISTHLDVLGCGVVVQAHHSCMGCRGARQPGADMITSSMLGVFREDHAVRAEFMGLIDR